MAKILIIEDEVSIGELIALNLKLVGHETYNVFTGENAIDQIKEVNPDLVILDVMLPYKDGFTLMSEIKPLNVPVIFLSAKDSLNDKVKGLQLGADDYIVKPFATIELITRIDTVLRRFEKKSENVFVLNDVKVKLDEHVVFYKEEEIELTSKEFSLLEILIKNKNIALSREKLLELVWGYEYIGETRTIDVHIQKLRKKLSLENSIKTVYKLGYRLEVPR